MENRRRKLRAARIVALAIAAGTAQGALAQESGYVFTTGGSTCSPPICTVQTYDSWGQEVTPVWHLLTHNLDAGGGAGMSWLSSPSYFLSVNEGIYYPLIAGSADFEPGHAFNLFSLSNNGSGCPFVHLATPENSLENFTELDHPALNGVPAALLLVTPLRMDSRIDEHIGVWYNTATGRWNIFYQDTTAIMEPGAQFVVLSDDCAVGLEFRPVHVATVGNTLGSFTALDAPDLDGRPSEVLFVTQVWDEEGPVYNDNPVAVSFDAAARRWRIVNEGGAAMPLGARFHWARAAVVHRCDFELGLNGVGFDGWTGVSP